MSAYSPHPTPHAPNSRGKGKCCVPASLIMPCHVFIGMTATPCEKGKQKNVGSAVRRNLNTDSSFSHVGVDANVQGMEPLSFNDTIHALEALTSRNGLSLPNSCEQLPQQVGALKEWSQCVTSSTEGHTIYSQQPEDSDRAVKSANKQRRRSSRSRSSDKAEFQACSIKNQELSAHLPEYLDRNASCSKGKSFDEMQAWEVASIISAEDRTQPTTGTILSPQGHVSANIKTLHPEVRLTPLEHQSQDVHSRITPSHQNSPEKKEKLAQTPTTLGHEMQLCIPKLVITKIKQRRGSKEVETHKVRAVYSDEEGVSLPMGQKRKRLSDEESNQQYKEGTIRI